MSHTLTHTHGNIKLTDLDDGRMRVDIHMHNAGAFVMDSSWETGYSRELVAAILEVKGPAWLCDELRRDEDAAYVENDIRHDVFGFVDPEDFEGRKILDFGCGCGASISVLSRLAPGAILTGVELDEPSLNIAKMRASHYNLTPRLSLSPDSQSLPQDLGTFDTIIFSAVFEHLLPDERLELLPLVWKHLKPGGLLFLNQTPHRWFPIEGHTTGLPLINYLPRSLTHLVTNRLSPRISNNPDWPTLLRMGIRGGTVDEIMGILQGTGEQPQMLAPTRLGLRDHLDLWDQSSRVRHGGTGHKMKAMVLRMVLALTGKTLVPNLSLAIRKEKI
jgi:2-polyprenyl-3-methyl-5-hydroxy-6-metoxy-1,4-benzoquinol methylase